MAQCCVQIKHELGFPWSHSNKAFFFAVERPTLYDFAATIGLT